MDECVRGASAYHGLSDGRRRRVFHQSVLFSRSDDGGPYQLCTITLTDQTCQCELGFSSSAPVLPNGSLSIPLDSVQGHNQGCHLDLKETTGSLNGNGSNSGDFFIEVQSVS